MIKLNVLNEYDIVIERGALRCVGQRIAEVMGTGKRACVVSDDNVAPIYAEFVLSSLASQGIEASLFVFPHGEGSKHIGTVTKMLSFFAESTLTRSDFVIALGGGIVGDLAGFAAAIYLRGIKFVQIPTSLLAQIDSSVGGKTGCDLPSGKNLAGAFKHPSFVLIDPDVLDTLPDEYMRDGMGEMIKYGAIKSEALLSHLESSEPFADIDECIYECVKIKAEIVEKDFTEQGERALLNFGHTIGHAIEKAENFCGISHGAAVAAGMCIITRAAEKVQICTAGTASRIEGLCEKYGLPTGYDTEASTIAEATKNDKKRSLNTINLILLRKIGDSFICPVGVNELEKLFDGSMN